MNFFKLKYPILSVLCLVALESTQASTVVTMYEEQLEGLMPNSMVDFTGFNLPSDFALALPEGKLGREGTIDVPVLPMFPIFKKGFASQQFLGVKIPAPYLSNEKLSSDSISINSVAPNTITQRALDEISKIRFSDGLRLTPYLYNGDVYGIRSDYQVTVINTTQFGFGFNFGASRKVFNLGQENSMGFFVNLAPPTEFNSPKGFNVGKTFNDLIGDTKLLFEGEQAKQLIERTVRFTPYIQHYLFENSRSSLEQKSASSGPLFETTYNINFILVKEDTPNLKDPIPQENFSRELRENFRNLNSNLSNELQWQKTLKSYSNSTLLVNSQEANGLVQTICDYLSQSYQMPKEIWPRCRIVASWAPNAWALPSGDIFITAGLIGVLSDLDSVMMVLGHEIGHNIGRHVTRLMPARNLYIYSASALGLAMNASLAKFSLAGGAGQLGQVTYLSWFPQSMVASVGGGLILGKAWDILNFAPVAGLMAHSREMEWEADRSGHQVALASGAKQENVYNGMSEFLEFGRKYFNEPNGLFQKLLLSHPNWGDRTQKVKERYSEYWNSLKSFNTSNRLDEVFYKQYHSIHMEYKTGVERWGANNKSKSQNGQRLQSDYLAMSLMSPAGRCIIYALGGDLNLETEVPKVPSSWKPNATFKNH